MNRIKYKIFNKIADIKYKVVGKTKGLEVSGMRTSRINAVPSSIFRNSRQYLHSNELFHRVLEEGNHFSSKQQQHNQNHQPNKRTGQQAKVVLNRTSKGAVMKGLLLDCNEVLLIQNKLLERSNKILEARNKIKCFHSYRSSI